MRIAIVDDLPKDSQALQEDICRWAKETQTPLIPPPIIFESGEALLEHMREGIFDVIFLDIYMKGINGMDTARHVRETDQNCRIIFTTFTPEFAVESYDVDSSYYLVKPYNYEKLSRALSRCNISFLEQRQFINVQGDFEQERLYLHDILFTEYLNRRVIVHLKNGQDHSIPMRHRDLAEVLLQYPYFCDCMKGVLINFEAVEQLQKDRFLLKSGQYVPISRLKYTNVRDQFLEYIYTKTRNNL